MIKIAIIGAGSIGFTRKLMRDILTVPELQDTLFHFHDIDRKYLDMMTKLARREIKLNGVKAKIKATLDRRESVTDADYVINVARVGLIDAFRHDIDIPLKYGVDQCVGDTLCAGGIMYGQRGVVAMLDFCKDIREVAKPGALLLSYGNPNAMLTWAANHYGGVDCIGLCHGVMGGHALIARALKLPKNEVDIICAGINHQTWYISIKHNGVELKDKLLAAMEADEKIAREEKIRIDLLRRSGYFSTESNGHLSEYVAWYRKRPDEIMDWIDLDRWILGETGGYLRSCSERRDIFEVGFPKWMREEVKPYTEKHRSVEHGSSIIESLETGRTYRGHFNVVNNGAISNLPDDCIVEVPGYVDGNGVSIPGVGDLPTMCAAICSQSVGVQRLAVEAAVNGDAWLLKQAMMMDPLVGAVCSPSEIDQMTDEMLVAQAEWLPQYKKAIREAKCNLKGKDLRGRMYTEGGARLESTENSGEMLDELAEFDLSKKRKKRV